MINETNIELREPLLNDVENPPSVTCVWFTEEELKDSFAVVVWNKSGVSTTGHMALETLHEYLSVFPDEMMLEKSKYNTQADDRKVYNRRPDRTMLVKTDKISVLEAEIRKIKRIPKYSVKPDTYMSNSIINDIGYLLLLVFTILITLICTCCCFCCCCCQIFDVISWIDKRLPDDSIIRVYLNKVLEFAGKYSSDNKSYDYKDRFKIADRKSTNCTDSVFLALCSTGLIDGYEEKEFNLMSTAIWRYSIPTYTIGFAGSICYNLPFKYTALYGISSSIFTQFYNILIKIRQPSEDPNIIPSIISLILSSLIFLIYPFFISHYIDLDYTGWRFMLDTMINGIFTYMIYLILNPFAKVLDVIQGVSEMIYPEHMFNKLIDKFSRDKIYVYTSQPWIEDHIKQLEKDEELGTESKDTIFNAKFIKALSGNKIQEERAMSGVISGTSMLASTINYVTEYLSVGLSLPVAIFSTLVSPSLCLFISITTTLAFSGCLYSSYENGIKRDIRSRLISNDIEVVMITTKENDKIVDHDDIVRRISAKNNKDMDNFLDGNSVIEAIYTPICLSFCAMLVYQIGNIYLNLETDSYELILFTSISVIPYLILTLTMVGPLCFTVYYLACTIPTCCCICYIPVLGSLFTSIRVSHPCCFSFK